MWSLINGYNIKAVDNVIRLLQLEVDELNKGRYLVTFETTKYMDAVVINIKVRIGDSGLTLLNGELGNRYRLFSPVVSGSGLIVMGTREGHLVKGGTSTGLFVDDWVIESNIRGLLRGAYMLLVNVGGYDLGNIMDELSKSGYIMRDRNDVYCMVKGNNYGSISVYLRGEGSLQFDINILGCYKVLTKDIDWLGSDEFFEFNHKVDILLGSYESYKCSRDALLKELDSNFNQVMGKELDSLS